jgi:hypothetical protein
MGKIAITAMIGLVMSCSAPAAIIYDNLSVISDGVDAVTSGSGPLYDSFTTPIAGALTGLQLLLAASNPADGQAMSVTLLADSGTTPGSFIALLGFIDDSSLSGIASAISVSLLSNPLLAASTRYWIGLATSGSAEWSWSSDTSGVGVASEYFSNAGGTHPNSEGPYQMQVTVGGATATPEPATGALGAGALAAMAFLARRRAANDTAEDVQ